LDLPSAARPKNVSKKVSVLSAGRTWISVAASSGLGFRQLRNARRHHIDFTGLEKPLLAAGPDHDRRAADLEAFLLLGMDVRRRDETAGREIEHEFEQLTPGVARSLAEHDPLAGHGMDDRVLCCPNLIRR
jgi:hypothetical protein